VHESHHSHPPGGRLVVDATGCQRRFDDASCVDSCACDGIEVCSATGPTPTGCVPGGTPCNQDRDLCTIEACCETDGDYSECGFGDSVQQIQAICDRVQSRRRLSRRLLYTQTLPNGQEVDCVRKAQVRRRSPFVGESFATYAIQTCDDGNQCTDDPMCNPSTGNCPPSTGRPRGTSCTEDGAGNPVQPPPGSCVEVGCSGGRDLSGVDPAPDQCALLYPTSVVPGAPISCTEVDTGVDLNGLSLFRLAGANEQSATYQRRSDFSGADFGESWGSCLKNSCPSSDGQCVVRAVEPDDTTGQNPGCPNPEGECVVGSCVVDESQRLTAPDGVPVVGCQVRLSDAACPPVTCSDGRVLESFCQPSSGVCSNPCVEVP